MRKVVSLFLAVSALTGCEYAGMGPQPELQRRLTGLSDAWIMQQYQPPSYVAPVAPTVCPPRRFSYTQSYPQGC